MLKKLKNSFLLLLLLWVILFFASCSPLAPTWVDYHIKFDTSITNFMSAHGYKLARSELRIDTQDRQFHDEMEHSFQAYQKTMIRKKDAIYRRYKRKNQSDTLIAHYPLKPSQIVKRPYVYPGQTYPYLTFYEVRGALPVLPFASYDSLPSDTAFNAQGLQCELLGEDTVMIDKKKYDCYKFKEMPTAACRERMETYENPNCSRCVFQVACVAEIWIDKKTLLPIKKKLWLDPLFAVSGIATPIPYGTYYFYSFYTATIQ